MYEVLSLDTNIFEHVFIILVFHSKIVIVKSKSALIYFLAHLSQRQKWDILIAKYYCTQSVHLSV